MMVLIEEDNKSQETNNSNSSNTSNSENVNENGKRCKKRATKKELYQNEREEIIKELENKIGLTKEKRTIMLYELEKNEEIKNRMKELSEKIKKIYRSSNWGYYSSDVKKGSGNEITLLRSVFKNSGYNIESKRKMVTMNGEKKIHIQLGFYKV